MYMSNPDYCGVAVHVDTSSIRCTELIHVRTYNIGNAIIRLWCGAELVGLWHTSETVVSVRISPRMPTSDERL